jgi:hypothetical protein
MNEGIGKLWSTDFDRVTKRDQGLINGLHRASRSVVLRVSFEKKACWRIGDALTAKNPAITVERGGNSRILPVELNNWG